MHIRWIHTLLLSGLLLVSIHGARAALDANKLPDTKRTPQALYLSAQEAFELRSSGQDVVLIDVRTREEAMYLGMPTTADALIPFMNIDARVWDPKRKAFRLVMNDEFEARLNELLHRKGLDADAKILLLCRSGKRSARAAKFLNQLGYSNVYTVVDGYEGDMAKSGEVKGRRAVNGWKNAGLPWTYDLDQSKFFFTD
jgi:rhodanese-related sulfurtransferase